MNKLYALIGILLAFGASCSNQGNTERRLAAVDSLLYEGLVDSAAAVFDGIQPHDLASCADSAYYFLLKTELTFRQYKPANPIGEVNYAINHYSTGDRDNVKLANAYYYKGINLYDNGDIKNGVEFIKNAEFIAEKTSDPELRHKVYEGLVMINEEGGDYRKAIEYCKRSIGESERAKRANWMAHTYNNMSVMFSSNDMPDSAKFYLNKSMALLKHIRPKDRIFIMNNIGVSLMHTDPQAAKHYFEEVIKFAPVTETFDNLASVYAAEGNEAKALELWSKGLETNDMAKKAQVLRSLFEYHKQKGELADAMAVANQLIGINDTLLESRNKNNVKLLQAEYDGRKSRQAYERKITWSITSAVLLALLATIAMLYSRSKSYKAKAIMARDQMRIKAYEAQVSELQRQGADRQKEIEQINRRKDRLIDKHRDTLNRGYSLFSEIQQGKTTILWKKKDFENVLEYYRLVDTEFSESMDATYEGLSPKYKFFLVLEHMGKTDAEIMATMGVAEVSLRSIRSRVNKTKSVE